MKESDLIKQIISRFHWCPNVHLARHNTGAYMSKGSRINYGEVGAGDIIGFAKPNGRHIEIECKSDYMYHNKHDKLVRYKGKHDPNQKARQE